MIDAEPYGAGSTAIRATTIVAVVAILLGLAMPPFEHLRRKALAARAAEDVNTIRDAARAYFADTRRWPRETGRGLVPSELRIYLPSGFDFERAEYVLDWENWEVPGGLPGRPAGAVLGIALITANPVLGRELRGLLGDVIAFEVGPKQTFVIQGL